MDALEAIWKRRSIREYTKEPVEFDKVMTIVEAGMCAPSSGNIQNWRFVVVTEKDLIKGSLYDACLEQGAIQNAQVVICVCADEELCERQYGLRGTRLYSIQNVAAAIENMLIAATATGLGATWIGAFNEERVMELLNIPEGVARPQALIPLGYPKEEPDEKRMRHIDDVVRFNDYGARYKDIHRVLKDISVEWERQIDEAKERVDVQSFLDKVKEFMQNGWSKRDDET
jgi:nitroreductase